MTAAWFLAKDKVHRLKDKRRFYPDRAIYLPEILSVRNPEWRHPEWREQQKGSLAGGTESLLETIMEPITNRARFSTRYR
jgi:hypothetical protein